MMRFSFRKYKATVVPRIRHSIALGVLMCWVAMFLLSRTSLGMRLLLCATSFFSNLGYPRYTGRLLDILPSRLLEIRLRRVSVHFEMINIIFKLSISFSYV